MLVSLDLPSELIFKLDAAIEQIKLRYQRPPWPFAGTSKIKDVNSLSKKEKQALFEYNQKTIVAAAWKNSGGGSRFSRSYFLNQAIQWAVKKGMIKLC